MASEFSIDTSLTRDPEPARSDSSWSSQPGAWNTIWGSTVTLPSGPFPRLSLMMYHWLFSPPSNR